MALPYAFDDLEPQIDAKTVELHYGTHYKGYVDNLNKATRAAGGGADGDDADSTDNNGNKASQQRQQLQDQDLTSERSCIQGFFGGRGVRVWQGWMMCSEGWWGDGGVEMMVAQVEGGSSLPLAGGINSFYLENSTSHSSSSRAGWQKGPVFFNALTVSVLCVR